MESFLFCPCMVACHLPFCMCISFCSTILWYLENHAVNIDSDTQNSRSKVTGHSEGWTYSTSSTGDMLAVMMSLYEPVVDYVFSPISQTAASFGRITFGCPSQLSTHFLVSHTKLTSSTHCIFLSLTHIHCLSSPSLPSPPFIALLFISPLYIQALYFQQVPSSTTTHRRYCLITLPSNLLKDWFHLNNGPRKGLTIFAHYRTLQPFLLPSWPFHSRWSMTKM
jgi:hypothetical protein